MTQTIFFLKNIIMGIQKTQNFMLSEMLLTKVKSKKQRKNAQNENTQNSHSFLALGAFV
jgi:hypothetical protein